MVIGIGVDLVDVTRFEEHLAKTPKLLERLFVPAEREASVQTVAGRWAAKEAVLKAMGTGWVRGISWRDIEIRNEPGGKPTVAVRGGAKDVVEQLGIAEIHVTISHCRSYATACAIAVAIARPMPRLAPVMTAT